MLGDRARPLFGPGVRPEVLPCTPVCREEVFACWVWSVLTTDKSFTNLALTRFTRSTDYRTIGQEVNSLSRKNTFKK